MQRRTRLGFDPARKIRPRPRRRGPGLPNFYLKFRAGVAAPDNSDRAYLSNALEIHIQSAISSDVDHPVAIYWYPALYGDSVTIEIEDGRWSLAGLPWAYQPMQPGLMKVSLIGDYANETRVRFKMRITRENYRVPPHNPIFEADLEMGDAFVIPVEIPAGTITATFDLTWKRTWNNYPTSDIDLLVLRSRFQPGIAGWCYPERARARRGGRPGGRYLAGVRPGV